MKTTKAVSFEASKQKARLSRSRNDSGVYEYADQDTDLDDVIDKWTTGVHSVVDQESLRMKQITEELKFDLNLHQYDEKRKLKLTENWKYMIRETVSLTQDLVECLSNDVLESLTRPSRPDGELEDIPEENYFYQDEDEKSAGQPKTKERFYLIRHKGRRGSQEMRTILKALLRSKPVNDENDMQWDAVSLKIDKMKKSGSFRRWFNYEIKRKPILKMKKKTNDFWKHAKNSIKWIDEEEEVIVESEDIFGDWIFNFETEHEDVNNLFWNISLEADQERKLNEEISSLPIGDRPDVFIDRCDILERRFHSRSTPKAYWNIFNSWKGIFWEKASPKIVRVPKSLKKLAEMEINRPEDIFRDSGFPDLLLPNSPMRRKQGPEVELPVLKRPRLWNYVEKEDPSIREAFRKYEDDLKILEGDLDENLDEIFRESRKEFNRLRYQVRVRRRRIRDFNGILQPEDWFLDWRWNLDAEPVLPDQCLYLDLDPDDDKWSTKVNTSLVKIFDDGYESEEYELDAFQDWKNHLDEDPDLVPLHYAEFIFMAASEIFKDFVKPEMDFTGNTPSWRHSTPDSQISVIKKKKVRLASLAHKSPKCPKMITPNFTVNYKIKPKAEKAFRRKMTKCLAKQPTGKIRT